MQDSIFTKIIKGEIPGEIIHEDAICIAMLTIEPFSPGHLLVIPRKQIDHLWDVDSETYYHLWDVARQMAKKLKHVYGYQRVGTEVEGFGVPHAHIHVFGYEQPLQETIIAFSQKNDTTASPEALHNEAEKIRNSD